MNHVLKLFMKGFLTITSACVAIFWLGWVIDVVAARLLNAARLHDVGMVFVAGIFGWIAIVICILVGGIFTRRDDNETGGWGA